MGVSLLRRLASLFGRDLVRKPRILVRHTNQELRLEFSFVLAHYLTANPSPFVLQVGACDGTTCDPLHELVRRCRLSGLLLEPRRAAFAQLEQAYAGQPGITLVRAAVARRDGVGTLYKIREDAEVPPWARGLASFDESVLLAHRKRLPAIRDLITTETVPCLTFASLFARYQLPRVDVLQVDTEGFDYEILKLFDVPARRPSLIHFEHKHFSRADLSECLELLLDCRYQVSVGSINTIAYQPAPAVIQATEKAA
jgi:FkbM family methyltransferase